MTINSVMIIGSSIKTIAPRSQVQREPPPSLTCIPDGCPDIFSEAQIKGKCIFLVRPRCLMKNVLPEQYRNTL